MNDKEKMDNKSRKVVSKPTLPPQSSSQDTSNWDYKPFSTSIGRSVIPNNPKDWRLVFKPKKWKPDNNK